MRICIVYDLLYPQTVGGAERWYRNVALRLAEEGHDVTYLTMRQWEPGAEPDLPGVRVVAVARTNVALQPKAVAGSCRRSCSAPASSGT